MFYLTLYVIYRIKAKYAVTASEILLSIITIILFPNIILSSVFFFFLQITNLPCGYLKNILIQYIKHYHYKYSINKGMSVQFSM